MGKRTDAFARDMGKIPDNVEIIPFLQKKDLEEEYKKCTVLLLPTRQECWGLVVNEAASFGTPIVSTWGSGAAVEFLSGSYPQYLAQPGNAVSFLECIRLCLKSDKSEYVSFLQDFSKQYSIENSVKAHMRAFEIV